MGQSASEQSQVCRARLASYQEYKRQEQSENDRRAAASAERTRQSEADHAQYLSRQADRERQAAATQAQEKLKRAADAAASAREAATVLASSNPANEALRLWQTQKAAALAALGTRAVEKAPGDVAFGRNGPRSKVADKLAEQVNLALDHLPSTNPFSKKMTGIAANTLLDVQSRAVGSLGQAVSDFDNSSPQVGSAGSVNPDLVIRSLGANPFVSQNAAGRHNNAHTSVALAPTTATVGSQAGRNKNEGAPSLPQASPFASSETHQVKRPCSKDMSTGAQQARGCNSGKVQQ